MAFAASAAKPRKIAPLGWVRICWRLCAMLAMLLACVPLYYICRTLRLPNRWPRIFLQSVGWITGARVRVVGAAVQRNVLIAANHVSWLDIPLLAGVNGTVFVAHDGLAGNRWLRQLCEMHNTVFVARGDRMSVDAQVNQLRDALDRNPAVTLFPEGTTGDGFAMLPFKSSLFSVVEPPPPNLVVQPVLIDYKDATSDIAWLGDDPGLDNALRLLARHHTLPVDIHYLPPFDPTRFDGRKAISAHVRAALEERLAAARAAHSFPSAQPAANGHGS